MQRTIAQIIVLVKVHVVSLKESLITGGGVHNYHLFKHSCIKNQPNTSKNDDKVISSRFKNNYCRRKIAEALLIKKIKPSLKVQDRSYELKLLNWNLLRNFFSVGARLYRNHLIDLHCQSVDWFLYSSCWNKNSP